MSLVFGTFMTFFTFLLFDNITKRSLWRKSRLLWHFWYFSSFCCLYKLVQACASLYKSKKVSCRFTDVVLMSYQLLHETRPTCDRQPPTLIHILDDDSLLNMFFLCRPLILDETEAVNASQILGGGEWNRERWWYRLVQVCCRWRYLILQSASHLHLSLFCAPGTPVTDMFALLTPLPLISNYFDDENNDIGAKDEEGLIYALRQRDRVRRIRLMKPVPILERLILNLDGEFPILEYLLIRHQRYSRPVTWRNRNLNLPESFLAPHLRHLLLQKFTIPIGSPLLATMGNLVTLSLSMIPPSAYFNPNVLLLRLSVMPQLEIFGITFNSQYPSGDIERQLLRAPLTIHVTLPSLRWFVFQGASAYLEMFLPGKHLDWQVGCAAQVFHMLRARISVLEHLTLQYRRHSISSEWNNEADRAQWRELLGSFDKVNTLHMDDELVGQLSRSLRPSEGESPTELLSELQELSYSAESSLSDAFTPLVDARRNAGRPIAVIRRD